MSRVYESPSAVHRRTGVIRIENLSGERGDITVTAIEDDGTAHAPITITVDAATATNINARDFEEGNPDKGIDHGLGAIPAAGRWRLELRTDLALRVLSYGRTDDGFLTTLQPVSHSESACAQQIHTFNPATNHRQSSVLRLVNPGEEEAIVFIRGTDDTGAPSIGTVSLTIEPHTARHLDSNALESGDGEGLDGALGNGTGKWRLLVTSKQHVIAMNLLASPTGHLTTLTAPDSMGPTSLEGRALTLTQHADNVIIAQIGGCLATSKIDFTHIAKRVIETYGDHFDFILFSSNLASVQDNTRYRAWGTHHRVQNDNEGLGIALGPNAHFNAIYGDRKRGKLKSFIHFPFRNGLTRGPGLHEIMHIWANFVVDTGSGSHWGFSSANGQLGGYDIADLVARGNNQYTAGWFGSIANGGNSVPYSPIELYLAGWLEAKEVPPLIVAQDAHWVVEDGVYQQDANGNYIFHASGFKTFTIDASGLSPCASAMGFEESKTSRLDYATEDGTAVAEPARSAAVLVIVTPRARSTSPTSPRRSPSSAASRATSPRARRPREAHSTGLPRRVHTGPVDEGGRRLSRTSQHLGHLALRQSAA